MTIVGDMLLAGIDTTSYTMSFLLYLLSQNQNIQKKLRDEINTSKFTLKISSQDCSVGNVLDGTTEVVGSKAQQGIGFFQSEFELQYM